MFYIKKYIIIQKKYTIYIFLLLQHQFYFISLAILKYISKAYLYYTIWIKLPVKTNCTEERNTKIDLKHIYQCMAFKNFLCKRFLNIIFLHMMKRNKWKLAFKGFYNLSFFLIELSYHIQKTDKKVIKSKNILNVTNFYNLKSFFLNFNTGV